MTHWQYTTSIILHGVHASTTISTRPTALKTTTTITKTNTKTRDDEQRKNGGSRRISVSSFRYVFLLSFFALIINISSYNTLRVRELRRRRTATTTSTCPTGTNPKTTTTTGNDEQGLDTQMPASRAPGMFLFLSLLMSFYIIY
jgi:hypothetical protein